MWEIYIDVYFFINLVIDFTALYSAERIVPLPESRARCVVGAVAGAVWAVADLIFGMLWIFDLGASFLCAYIISAGRGIKRVLAAWAVFMGCELFIGGCMTALMTIKPLMGRSGLVIAAMISAVTLAGYEFYSIMQYIAKRRLSSVSLGATVFHRGKRCDIVLLVDSGNLVTESETKRRVIFARAESLSDVIGDPETLFEREKCYVIPIDTPAGRSRVNAFIPDGISFHDKRYKSEDFMIVPDMRGGKFGGYDGIAPLM